VFRTSKLGCNLSPIFKLIVINQTLGSVDYVLLRAEFGLLLLVAVAVLLKCLYTNIDNVESVRLT